MTRKISDHQSQKKKPVILQLLSEKMTNQQIVDETGYSYSYVSTLARMAGHTDEQRISSELKFQRKQLRFLKQFYTTEI